MYLNFKPQFNNNHYCCLTLITATSKLNDKNAVKHKFTQVPNITESTVLAQR